MSKEIQLTRGYVTIVDDEDYEELSSHKWCFMGDARHPIACRRRRHTKTKSGEKDPPGFSDERIYMSRWIMKVDNKSHKEIAVDHINGNSLDNRRENLRLCAQSENLRNRRFKKSRSGLTGVHWSASQQKWVARLHLGFFDSKEDAKAFYDTVKNKVFNTPVQQGL